MRTTIDLQAITDRVFGVLPPVPDVRTGRPRKRDRLLVAAMLTISASSVLGSLGLWVAGHGMMGLRVLCGSVLVLGLLLRFR